MGNTFSSSKNEQQRRHSAYVSGLPFNSSKKWKKRANRSSAYFQVTPDIDRDRTLEAYLHYQAPNALEEDLFTKDTRNPCIIRLHQKAAHFQDMNNLLHGSIAYSKNRRPKSLDPNILLDAFDGGDDVKKRNNRNSTFFSSSNQLNSTRIENNLPTPEERMKLDANDSIADVITIDTSGSKYERQANARKSMRSGSCSVRQKPITHRRSVIRQRHKTLTGIPDNAATELELSQSSRSGGQAESYMILNVEETSPTAINGHAITPRDHVKNAEMQTEDVHVVALSSAQRRSRKRHSQKSNNLDVPIPVECPSVHSDSLSQSTDDLLSRPDTLSVPGSLHTSAFNSPCSNHARTPASPTSDAGVGILNGITPHMNGDVTDSTTTQNQHVSSIGAKRGQLADDRISSGFWSGTESTRHSGASEIAQQHAHVTQALQQMMKNPRSLSPPDSAISVTTVVHEEDKLPNWYASSIASSSVNSCLSTLDQSHFSSASSLRVDDENRFKSSDSSVISTRIEQALGHPEGRKKRTPPSPVSSDAGSVVSARSLLKNKSTEGDYSFMNSVEDNLNKTPIRKSSRFSFKGRKSSKRTVKAVESPSSVTLERKAMPAYNGGVAMSECSFMSEDSSSIAVGDSIVCGMYSAKAMSVSSIEKEGSPLRNSTRNDGCETPTPMETPMKSSPAVESLKEAFNHVDQTSTPVYFSYQRAVKTNHEVPKSLIEKANSSKSETSSTGTISPHSTTPQVSKKAKGPKPPPPKRNSSLSASNVRSPNLPTVQEDKLIPEKIRSPLATINGNNFMNELESAIKSSHSTRSNRSSSKSPTLEKQPAVDVIELKPAKLSSKYPEMAYMEPLRSSNNNNNAVISRKNDSVDTMVTESVKPEKKPKPAPPPKPVRTSSIRSPSGPTTPKKSAFEDNTTNHKNKTLSPAYFSTNAVGHNWARISDTTIKHPSVNFNEKKAANSKVEDVKTPVSADRRGSDDVFIDPVTLRHNVADNMKSQASTGEENAPGHKSPPTIKPKPSISSINASARAAFFASSFEEPKSEKPANEEKLDEIKVATVAVESKQVKIEVSTPKPVVKDEGDGDELPLPANEDVVEGIKNTTIEESVLEKDNKEVTGNQIDDDDLRKENESNMSEIMKLETSSSGKNSQSLRINIPPNATTLDSTTHSPIQPNSAVARLLGTNSSLRQKRSTAFSRSKSLNSPPISPGIKDGLSSPTGSPMSTLERRKNKRLSSSITGKPTTRTTSRDDFKNLLLQSAVRTSSDGRMSATEKLKLTKNKTNLSSTLPRSGKSLDSTDSHDNSISLTPRSGIASERDIRSRIRAGRSYARATPKLSVASESMNGKPMAKVCLHSDQPPVSLSGKYNAKRSRTPTRLMMSITEDSEHEKSPESTRPESE